MSVRERSAAAEVEAGRARYVARGVATPRLVVARAEGARVEDPDGRSYIDFAGGIACQNLGHRPDAVTAAIVFLGVPFSVWTIVVGHATFCVVIVYNNVLARLRRTSGSFFEASADLGATGFQTFRYVTLPTVGTALVAGALLAFALSWDEIVVTYFTAGAQNTLPLLIFGFMRQGENLPIVNAVALFVIVISVVPVLLAQRLTSDPGVGRR